MTESCDQKLNLNDPERVYEESWMDTEKRRLANLLGPYSTSAGMLAQYQSESDRISPDLTQYLKLHLTVMYYAKSAPDQKKTRQRSLVVHVGLLCASS